MKKHLLSLSLIGFMLSGVSPAAFAQGEAAAEQNYVTKSEIEALIKDYILQNGDIVMQSVNDFQARQEAEQARAAEEAIKTEAAFLFENTASPTAGASAENAAVTVVEFFDYNCGFCKRAVPDVTSVLENNDDVRVVFKEVPILSQSSREIAKWALAADKQDKYLPYHVALMEHRGQYDESVFMRLAEENGLDAEKLKADKDDPALDEILNENLAYMNKFGIRGTPSFIVGDELARGYIGQERLQAMIDETRAENAAEAEETEDGAQGGE